MGTPLAYSVRTSITVVCCSQQQPAAPIIVGLLYYSKSSSSSTSTMADHNATASSAQGSNTLMGAETASTLQQAQTERECAPFFVDLASLPASQLEHLRETGLIVAAAAEDGGGDSSNDPQNWQVQLLREAHARYLSRIFDEPVLHRSFVSLDSSRPWMIYWCWHALDLMGMTLNTEDDDDTTAHGRDAATLLYFLSRHAAPEHGRAGSRAPGAVGVGERDNNPQR